MEVPPPASRRKRAYEYSEGELDVTMEKLYKCNYWEDPAYAGKLQRYGLELARSAALDNLIDSVNREFQAYMAGGQLKEDDEEGDEMPTWALTGGVPAAVGRPRGSAPLVEEFWDKMRRYAVTVLEPIVELLKNPVTALLIVAGPMMLGLVSRLGPRS